MTKVQTMIVICFFSGCAFFSDQKQMRGIIVSHEIFLDGKPKTISVAVDDIVPGLKASIATAINSTNLSLKNDNADILLKVKTKFYGSVPVSKKDEILKNDISLYDINGIKKPYIEKRVEKTKIDRLLEDPSGMIVGFALGVGMSSPMVAAPVGMAIGAGANLAVSKFFEEEIHITILEIEIHEKAKKPLWYSDKRIHLKDRHSIRKYDFSEKTLWKVYKTRIIVQGEYLSQEVSKRIASLVI